MEMKRLGDSDLKVSPLMFGGNVFGWTANEAMSFRLLDAWVDAGFNFIDTADYYSRFAPGNVGGESETILGKWLNRNGNRDKVVIATKVGMEMGPGKEGLSKPYIMRAVEDSLHRLNIDHIDLYQSHKDDLETPLDETLEAFGELVKHGKVRYIGGSNYTPERLKLALKLSKEHGYPKFQTLQPLYNLYDRSQYEGELESVCVENGLGVISYYSLGAGFLVGKYRDKQSVDKSARKIRIEKYWNERGWKILKALDDVAANLNSTPGKVALAWVLARQSITAPIVSATNLTQLNDLFEATSLTLDNETMQTLNQASA
ncbi:MAG: aldo/keto reductase [Candidatus Obscuribacterales bacterium]|nr:aldo/keto reductase [Candidatus Obscuribacterales bacterium]